MNTQIVPRQTIATVVAKRALAFEALTKAHAAMVTAAQAKEDASGLVAAASNFMKSQHVDFEHRARQTQIEKVEPLDEYLASWRRVIDADIWENIIQLTGIDNLMDKTARQKLYQEMKTEPPEVTEENVRATLETLTGDADMIFKRSIATVFSGLDRRFRSHNVWKINNRVIFTNAFNEWGSWSHYNDRQSDLRDVERVFMVLEGLAVPDKWHGICGAIDEARKGGHGARQTFIHSEYFKIRVYKNGNCHIWFERLDLVEKANKLIAEYYGDVIPDDCTEIDESGLNNPKLTPAKNFGFFPSPDPVVWELFKRSPIKPGERLLEPSAGTGNIAFEAVRKGAIVDCVEIQAEHAEALAKSRKFSRVYACNFLEIKPETLGEYDTIIMNPPFDRGRDIDHIMHAFKFLKEGGSLVSVMHAGIEFSQTKKAVAFRKFVDEKAGRWNRAFHDLPERSFAESGTNVNAVTVQIFK